MKWFWIMLSWLGFWIPCDRLMPPAGMYDWVLISYYEKGLDYRYVPKIAEYSYRSGEWHGDDDVIGGNEFLNSCIISHWRKIPSDKQLKIKNFTEDL